MFTKIVTPIRDSNDFYPRDVVSAVLCYDNVAGQAGWLDVTRRCCITTAQTYLKTFSTTW